MLAFLVQFGNAHLRPEPGGNPFEPFVALVAAVCVAALLLQLLVLLVPRFRGALTIAQALDAMVADRRTDETLEQIERGAVADGSPWGDP